MLSRTIISFEIFRMFTCDFLFTHKYTCLYTVAVFVDIFKIQGIWWLECGPLWTAVVSLLAGQTTRQEAAVINRQNLTSERPRSILWWLLHQCLWTVGQPGAYSSQSTSVWSEPRASRSWSSCLLCVCGVRHYFVCYSVSLVEYCVLSVLWQCWLGDRNVKD